MGLKAQPIPTGLSQMGSLGGWLGKTDRSDLPSTPVLLQKYPLCTLPFTASEQAPTTLFLLKDCF